MGMLEKRPYGKTGEHVSVLGLGGGYLNKYSYMDGVATVRRALELGVSYFDTSPFYGQGATRYGTGASQAILGEALEGRSESFLVATKVGHFAAASRFRSADAIRTQIDENLRLLRRDSVDVLQIHESDWQWWWTDTPQEEMGAPLDPSFDYDGSPVMDVLREARAEGRCRYIGITANDSDKLARVLGKVDVDTCLSAYGYDTLRRGTRRDIMPVARKAGVVMIVGGVLSSLHDTAVHPEWLTSPPPWMTPDLRADFEGLYRVQSECGLSLIELTLRYLLADREVSTVLVGAARPAEIEEWVEAAEKGPLPSELHDAIERLVHDQGSS